MTRFQDGPAQPKPLMLKRAPKFLRVTVDADGTVDALDQLDDKPRKTERLFCYIRVGTAGVCHILRREPGKGTAGSGFYATAEYKLCDPQPTDADMREMVAWHTWTMANRNL